MQKTGMSEEVKNAIATTNNSITELFTKDYSEQFMVQKGDKVAYKVEYNLYNKVKDHTSLKLTDREMINSTEKIRLALGAGEKMKKILCREIFNLSKNVKLEKLGFKTVAAYCKAMFDMATSTTGLYAQIGQFFIDENYNDVIDETEYLKVGHLLELLPLVRKDMTDDLPLERLDRVIEAFSAGYVNDMMSTKAMRQAIKDNYPELVETKKREPKNSKKNPKEKDTSEDISEDTTDETLDDVMRAARVISDIEHFKEIAIAKNVEGEKVHALEMALTLIESLVVE